MAYRSWMTGSALVVAALSGAALAQSASTPQAAPAVSPPSPYLTRDQMPNSAEILPPPPAFGSQEMQRDEAGAADAIAHQSGPRWELAKSDAVLTPAAMDATFSCAAGIEISPTATPALSKVMAIAGRTMGMSTGKAKDKYQRPRPFMINNKPSCTPKDEAGLRTNGSYPSGHSAMGYGTALVLTELFPDRATQIIARGRAYGDSRRVCNVHWASDIEEGRFMASATFARLQADPVFQQEMAAAKAELAALGDKAPLKRDCAAEAAALAGK